MRMLGSALVVLALAAALVVPAGAQKQSIRAATVVTVTAGKPGEFSFTLSTHSVPAGIVNFNVTNGGAIPHDFSISGHKTRLLSPGQSQTISVNFSTGGSFPYLCTVPGHADGGMKGVLTVVSSAPAAVKLSATMRPTFEVPAPKGVPAGAAGKFTATLTGKTLKWHLTFTHLSGPATASHIHLGVRGKAGPVMKALCGPCSSPKSGTAILTATQATSIKNGKTYVNVHTKKNPAGEIRGQILKLAS